MKDEGKPFDELLARLAALTGPLDLGQHWPAEQLELLSRAGVLKWCIPEELGGSSVTPTELIRGYQRLARACLTTAFILTQRNGACQRIADSKNEEIRAHLLPGLARGELFATVGISHLTTSRQHRQTPAVFVEQTGRGFRFSGGVPWVTGAAHADCIVTGGTLADGMQVLAAIPIGSAGVTVHAYNRLLALTASHTAEVDLDGVEVDEKYLLAGPVEQVMKKGPGAGTGSLATSALALGLTQGTLAQLQQEADSRPELVEILAPLAEECSRLEAEMYQGLEDSPESAAPALVRTRANSLVLRSTQALFAASKGAGFVEGHPAGRAVREALFFLVWSCPQPVLTAALRELAGVV